MGMPHVPSPLVYFSGLVEHKKAAVDPGGEFFGLLGGEVQLRKWFVAAEVNALQSRRTRAFGVVTGTTRRLVAVQLSGGRTVYRAVAAKLGIRVPVLGRNYPAGPQLVVGFRTPLRFVR